MSTDDNNAYGELDKSNLKFIYEQFLMGIRLFSRKKNAENSLLHQM